MIQKEQWTVFDSKMPTTQKRYGTLIYVDDIRQRVKSHSTRPGDWSIRIDTDDLFFATIPESSPSGTSELRWIVVARRTLVE